MRRLILMRHAKSAWDDPEAEDRDRPLARRGRLAATLMGALLAEDGLVPEAALISDARRARETWDRTAAASGADAARARILPALYMAEPETSLAALRGAPAAAETVLMVGHEPGTTAFLRAMSDGTEGAGARRAYEKFPTAAVAVLEFGAPWAEAGFGGARVVAFHRPKDLV